MGLETIRTAFEVSDLGGRRGLRRTGRFVARSASALTWCRAERNPRSIRRFRARRRCSTFSRTGSTCPIRGRSIAQTSWTISSRAGWRTPAQRRSTVRELVNPKLAPEMRIGADDVTSHETGASMVRRSGHLQGLGEPLAERGLRHFLRAFLDRSSTTARTMPPTNSGATRTGGSGRSACIRCPSSIAISTTRPNTPETSTQRQAGC